MKRISGDEMVSAKDFKQFERLVSCSLLSLLQVPTFVHLSQPKKGSNYPWSLVLCDCGVPQEWPPEVGSIFESSVLAWNYDNKSFWRGAKNVSMAEVVGYAKSIALTRFREVGYKCIESISLWKSSANLYVFRTIYTQIY